MKNELFKTNVGSHIWEMSTPDSDIDYFIVYLAPLEDILLQRRPKSKHQMDGRFDFAIHEIGHVIGQLKKSNFNFVIGIMSPLIVSISPELAFLRNWVKNNISKQIYYSIRGLALSNYDDCMTQYTPDAVQLPNQKKARLVMRTLMFGIHLLRTGEFLFRPVGRGISAVHINYYLKELDKAFEESNLPDYVTNYDELEEWLIGVRLVGV